MKKKIIKWGLIIIMIGILTGGSIIFYMFNMPHRDIQASPIDFTVSSVDLISEYLEDPAGANDKYLQEEGESRILAVTGRVASIDEDLNNQKVILLKEENEKLGVLCYFMKETNSNAESLKPGDRVTIKGVIRSGAEYDEDLDLYEDAILEKCDILK